MTHLYAKAVEEGAVVSTFIRAPSPSQELHEKKVQMVKGDVLGYLHKRGDHLGLDSQGLETESVRDEEGSSSATMLAADVSFHHFVGHL